MQNCFNLSWHESHHQGASSLTMVVAIAVIAGKRHPRFGAADWNRRAIAALQQRFA